MLNYSSSGSTTISREGEEAVREEDELRSKAVSSRTHGVCQPSLRAAVSLCNTVKPKRCSPLNIHQSCLKKGDERMCPWEREGWRGGEGA